MHPLLLDAAHWFLNDPLYGVTERVERWRTFLREVSVEKERQLRGMFYAVNGFDAADRDAKRHVIDETAEALIGRRPLSDVERDMLTDGPSVMRPLMRIGWQPIFTEGETIVPACCLTRARSRRYKRRKKEKGNV